MYYKIYLIILIKLYEKSMILILCFYISTVTLFPLQYILNQSGVSNRESHSIKSGRQERWSAFYVLQLR